MDTVQPNSPHSTIQVVTGKGLTLLLLRQQAGYWKTMHERVRARLAACEAEVAALQAKLKLRERQAFGRKSEKSSQRSEASHSSSAADAGTERRKRGQQRGRPQPTRRNY